MTATNTTRTAADRVARLEAERAFATRAGASDRGSRERVERLLDPGSFLEVGLLARDITYGRAEKTPTDAMIAGYGTVDGHRVGVLSLDGAVLAGSGGHSASAKQERIVNEAFRLGFPVISFGEGGGGRIPDMMGSSLGFAGGIAKESLLTRIARRGRPFPLIACCVGEMYGDPSFKLGLSDFPLMLRGASLGISGPPVIRAALGEEVSGQELGGPEVHERNGQVARVEETEEELIHTVRRILDFLLARRRATTDPVSRPTPEIGRLLPESYQRAYDVNRVIRALVDRDCEPLSLWPNYGRTAVACLARMGGRAVGVFANQPLINGGVLDVETSRKGAMFLRRCDRFGLPVIFLHDVPGFLIGRGAEQAGILGAAMDYLTELSSATVPKISLVLRKSYGLAYFAMAGPGWGGDYVAALPNASIAFMGSEPGINLVYAKKLREAVDRETTMAELRADWEARAEPWEAAYLASLDDVILPEEARSTLCRALAVLENG